MDKSGKIIIPIFGLFLLAALAQTGSAQQQPDTLVSGRVTSSLNVPLENAQVIFVPNVSGRLTQDTIEVLTDSDGKFAADTLPPGIYQVMALKTGYAQQIWSMQPGGERTFLKVESGDSHTGIDFALEGVGTVRGHVTDSSGQPARGINVRLALPAYQDGKRSLTPGGGNQVITYEDGSFEIAQAPEGRYYVVAEDRRAFRRIDSGDVAIGARLDGFSVPTLYPDATTIANAQRIEVITGSATEGINIRLRSEPLFQVRGKAVDQFNNPVEGVTLRLVAAQEENLSPVSRISRKVTGPDGSFSFVGLPSGEYRLMTMPGLGPNRERIFPELEGRLDITLTTRSEENLTLRMLPSPLTRATVLMEDGSPVVLSASGSENAASQDNTAPQPRLILNNRLTPDAGGLVDSNGSVEIAGVGPDPYYLSVVPLPPNHFIKRAQFAGQALDGRFLDLSSGAPGELQVTISPNGAVIDGVVRNGARESLPAALVTLWPDAQPGEWFLTDIRITDRDGAFRFDGLAPGGYTLAAWIGAEPGAISLPEFRNRFADRTQHVTIEEGGTLTLDLEIIPAAAVDLAMQSLP